MQVSAFTWLFSLRPMVRYSQNYCGFGWRTLFWEYSLIDAHWGARAARWRVEHHSSVQAHWLNISWADPHAYRWWACSVYLKLRPQRYHLRNGGPNSLQHTWLWKLWYGWAMLPDHQWRAGLLAWALKHDRVPLRWVVLYMRLVYRPRAWAQRLVRRIWRKASRLSIAVRLRPVHIAFHGYCCDTGPYTWTRSYGWALSREAWQDGDWGWPGLRAWRRTTGDALHGASDGATDYSLISASDVEEHEPQRCDGCGAGNAPYSMTDSGGGNVFAEPITYNFCRPCYQHEMQYEEA